MSFLRSYFLRAAVLAAAAVALLPPVDAHAGNAAKRPIVVELYTSQGCNECPPADALLGQIATRKDLIVLTLPINYWDMLGWKDTLATDADTKRQKAYAQIMGRGGVYTPQVIVDGITDVVGGREAQISAAIAARAADETIVPVSLSADSQEVHITVGSSDQHSDATIWIFRVQPQATVKVGGGENAGRTLSYTNVVRDIRAVGIWKGQTLAVDLPRQELTSKTHDAIAVVVQQGGYGRVVGATMLNHPNFFR